MSGYSGTPLSKKLGYKAGFKALVVNGVPHYHDLLIALPEGVEFCASASDGPFDLIHIFSKSREELEELMHTHKAHLVTNGMIWVSWPKKTAKIPTDLDGGAVRGTGLAAGLVDVKVCAVDEQWSGHKFVYRLKDR